MNPVVRSITALSPVAAEVVLCRQGGVLWATLVAKATFEMVPGSGARLVAPLPLVTRDRASAGGGSLEAGRETAPHLPRGGVVLTGHAHAAGGRAVPSMSVRLGVSRDRPVVDKTLHVFGSRSAANPGVVLPFQKMPLVYERAFGGPGVWDNPVGTGAAGTGALPNVVDPKDPKRVAGFGALAGRWMPRRVYLGGSDEGCLEQAIFEGPRGFDWRYFQVAPADQEIDEVRGDEWIVLDGMHPSLPRVQTRLPQVKAAARRSGPGGEAAVDLRGDMLVIDADRMVASVVWRGRFPAGSEAALGATSIHVALEMPGKAVEWPKSSPRQGGAAGGPARASVPVQETQEVNLAALFGREKMPFDGERPSALPPSQGPKPQPFSTGTTTVDVSKVLGKSVPFAEAVATTELPAVGVAGGAGGAGAGAFSPTETAAIGEVPAGAREPLPFAKESAGPARVVLSAGPVKATPMSTGTTDIDVRQILKMATPYQGEAAPVVAPAVVAPAVVAPAVVAPAVVAPPVMAAAVAVPPVVSPPVSPPRATQATPVAMPSSMPSATAKAPGDPGVRAVVVERLREGQSLEGLKLTGADLHELDLGGARLGGLDLRRANLTGAKLVRAQLAGAQLAGARLTGADLTGADLSRADLTGAELEQAVFNDVEAPGSTWDKAALAGARFVGAKLQGAGFRAANLDKAVFAQATLSAANFQRASGREVDFRSATLESADLRQSSLPDAKMDDADLREVSATKADLAGAVFFRADLSSANLRAAKVAGADFTHAKLDDADLRDADVTGIKIDPTAARLAKLRLPR